MEDEILSLRPGAVSWREVDGETILLDVANSDYLGVNASGTVLWRLLTAGTSRLELISALCNQFAVEHDRASADVDAFLAIAQERGLLN